jgi:hypothetical protein
VPWLRTPRKVIHDLHTENDGKSYNWVPIAGSSLLIPAIPVFFWGVVYNTLQKHAFDFSGFALGIGGLGSLVLSLAAGVSIKARTDIIMPPPPPPPQGEPPCQQ